VKRGGDRGDGRRRRRRQRPGRVVELLRDGGTPSTTTPTVSPTGEWVTEIRDATWRTYANVRTDQGKAAYAGGTAKDTTDIQLGIYSYGRNRYVEWQADFTCWKGTDYTSRSKSGTKWVPAGEWRYILVRDAASQSDECDISGYIYPPALDDFGSTRLVLRVR